MEKIYKLPASFFFKRFSMFLLALTFCFGCATPYRHVEPHSIEYRAEPDILYNGNVEVTYRYNILQHARNKKYARMEQRSGISLIAVRIANYGKDTLFIPDDLLIESRNNCVFPLEMDDAIDVFIQDHPQVLDELGGVAGDVAVVNAGWGFIIPLAASIPSLINSSVEEKANDRFIQEMLDYYLVYSNVPPGETVSGLLALPVEPNTPLDFTKR